MAKKSGELVVGLDIGTTKICCIVGEQTDEGIDIIGIGTHPSKGLRKGVVVNIEATVGSIRRAIEEAELMAGCEISTVYTGIAGGHIKGINSQGIVAVKDKEVREHDIQRVIDAAKAIAIPLDREVIHVLPQEFIIDDQGGIRSRWAWRRAPGGQGAHRHRRGLQRPEHRQVRQPHRPQRGRHRAAAAGLGRVLPLRGGARAGRLPGDIGGGTTDFAISPAAHRAHRGHRPGRQQPDQRHRHRHAHPRPRGRAHQAEFGCALSAMVDKDEQIEVPSVGGRQPRVLNTARSSARSSSRGSRRSSSSCTARSRSAATRSCWPRAWSSPAAARC
jgi:cell division protein FtsA